MVVQFELQGQPFTALNGGPHFKFTEAVSMQIECATQEELDTYWAKLSEGGDPDAQQCGWMKDKYGLSWQVMPKVLGELMADPDPDADPAGEVDLEFVEFARQVLRVIAPDVDDRGADDELLGALEQAADLRQAGRAAEPEGAVAGGLRGASRLRRPVLAELPK